jgi:two-component system, NarL family, invasion response regulator UvrY
MTPDRSDTPVQVLVVDDQEMFRAVLRELVDGIDGMAVAAEATSGEEALEVARRIRPQLVVMDVRMPGIDGIEATERLVEAHPGTVVLLVSIDGAGEAQRIRASGAAAFLPKQKLTREALADAWREHGPGG